MRTLKPIAFLLVWLPLLSFAQTDRDLTLYLDSIGQPSSSSHYEYTRVIAGFYGSDSVCTVTDFYKSGGKKMTGAFTHQDLYKTGTFTFFYEDGKKALQFEYVQDIPTGDFFYWHENGRPQIEGAFVPNRNSDPLLTIRQFWSRVAIQRVKDGEGNFEEKDAISYAEGTIKDGFKQGKWDGADYKEQALFYEIYHKGKMLSGFSQDSTKQRHHYKKAYVAASPRKGLTHFKAFLQKKLKANAANNPVVQRGLLLGFTVEASGSLRNLRLLSTPDTALEQDLNTWIADYGAWKPAASRGIASETAVMLALFLPPE